MLIISTHAGHVHTHNTHAPNAPRPAGRRHDRRPQREKHRLRADGGPPAIPQHQGAAEKGAEKGAWC
jgi:hypothetical protein